MKKFVITEEDKKHIMGLYEQPNSENRKYLRKIKKLVDGEYFEAALQLGQSLGLEEEVNYLILNKKIDMLIVNDRFEARLLSQVERVTSRNINSRVNDIIYNYIETDSELKALLDQLDPNLRQEKYNEIFPKISKKFFRDWAYLFPGPYF